MALAARLQALSYGERRKSEKLAANIPHSGTRGRSHSEGHSGGWHVAGWQVVWLAGRRLLQ